MLEELALAEVGVGMSGLPALAPSGDRGAVAGGGAEPELSLYVACPMDQESPPTSRQVSTTAPVRGWRLAGGDDGRKAASDLPSSGAFV